ncbi:serine hydrolase domain-containing protein [Spirillospora sp. NPDC029432]|uniref:serine hydrolase domain-containing protein n=1 Tax=Spirillospora sp. NPDC029432 TaxID=3154599 RepID=UPI00345441F6
MLQQRIKDAIDRMVAQGTETGVQVSVYRHGEPVVEAVAGVADPATGRPVTPGTPFYAASTGKGVTATVVHVLAERGVLAYDTPIAELWPEFAAHGKGAATVRHALSHTLGLPGLPPHVTVEDLCDWDGMCALIAGLELWWEPGTKTAYHSHTYGHILGEVVRRATGRPISQVLREEVAGPLGVADELYFGVPAAEQGRLARLESTPEVEEAVAGMRAMFGAVMPPELVPHAAYGNRADVLAADIPAGGVMTARAVARMYAALLDEVDGVRLVSPDRLREISGPAFTGTDEIMGNPATWALGYALGPLAPARPRAFGMPGMGGSAAYADPDSGTAFAVTKNRFDPTRASAVDEIAAIVAEG